MNKNKTWQTPTDNQFFLSEELKDQDDAILSLVLDLIRCTKNDHPRRLSLPISVSDYILHLNLNFLTY